MELKIPDFTKITWQLNTALISAVFSIFSLIYNEHYIYYGFLTFVYGVVGHMAHPVIENVSTKNKYRNYIVVQSLFTILWIMACLFVYRTR